MKEFANVCRQCGRDFVTKQHPSQSGLCPEHLEAATRERRRAYDKERHRRHYLGLPPLRPVAKSPQFTLEQIRERAEAVWQEHLAEMATRDSPRTETILYRPMQLVLRSRRPDKLSSSDF